MKVNKSITDTKSGAIRAGGYGNNNNRVDPKYFKHFCKWMVEYVKLHDKQGVPFYAVSPGNEVQFSQSFESCVWDGKDFAAIVVMLRETLNAEGYGHVKIFGPETMTSHLYEGGTGSYVKAVLDNPEALKALDVFATHGYEDGVKAEMSANSSRQFWESDRRTPASPSGSPKAAPATTTGPLPSRRESATPCTTRWWPATARPSCPGRSPKAARASTL